MKKLILFAALSLHAQTAIQLSSGQSTELKAPAVTWSVSPAVGSVSQSGLYTAPSPNLVQQSVIVSAIAGTQIVFSQSITLLPDTITLPIEVVGPDGTSAAIGFGIPATASLSGPLTLSLQVHNLKYETMMSVRVNQGAWTPVSTANVTLDAQAAAYGGIGGGFSTITLTMPLPGTVTPGTNQIAFRFNGTDGRSSGFRVLAFNVANSAGNLIPASTFVWDDPTKWTAPLNTVADITAGKAAFQKESSLRTQMTGPAVNIKAACSDCHAQDGADLKYFNYSNNSIIARSVFHGLTSQQGSQIASYIRSLTSPSPGRVWNPPYQPGPGLDPLPAEQWSAGAGIAAVLPSDQAALSELFPNGITPAAFAATGNLNVRQTRIQLQMLDWNSWLPQVHPLDAWPDFATSKLLTHYQQFRTLMAGTYANAAVYKKSLEFVLDIPSDFAAFITPKEPAPGPVWTPLYVSQVYSSALWAMVKSWEVNHEFGLEGLGKTAFTNASADARAWAGNMMFLTSPNMLHIPIGTVGGNGVGNGSVATWTYHAQIWYQLQLILNNGNYNQSGDSPIDYQYVYAHIVGLSDTDSSGQTALMYEWLIKGLQESNNGNAPNASTAAWTWYVNDFSAQVYQGPGYESIWNGTSATQRTALYSGYLRAWLDSVEKFTPAQFYGPPPANAQVWANPKVAPVHGQPQSNDMGARVWYSMPLFKYFGVPQALITEWQTWAATVWPAANWSAINTATCAQSTYGIACSTEK